MIFQLQMQFEIPVILRVLFALSIKTQQGPVELCFGFPFAAEMAQPWLYSTVHLDKIK